ncbi:MAG TPA: glycoside hydrolase family 15 protein [Streptosporangiaceae bacterium]
MNGEGEMGDSHELISKSVSAMLSHQSPHGSFVASPDFGQYQYCWLRDGSFTAYALDVAGQTNAAADYHRWVARALAPLHRAMADAAALTGDPAALTGNPAVWHRLPPARFALDGTAVLDDWPNFQIDGYGAWLWSLREHLRLAGDDRLLAEVRDVVDNTWRYLDAVALDPCFDVWEENGDQVHTSTLACVHAGLTAAAELLGERRAADRAEEVRSFLFGLAAGRGRFPKSHSLADVDASTLWLCAPFGVVAADDPLMSATADAIKAELDLGGGIRRYAADTYYGGGAWPVLTASLGLYWLAAGDGQAARRYLAWIETKFDADGSLGEQFDGEFLHPDKYRQWVLHWGHPARELLWSHAMYVLLAVACGDSVGGPAGHPAS